MLKRLVIFLAIFCCHIEIVNASWVSVISEAIGKASGKTAKVVDDVPIPKHAPDVAPDPKPSFEPVPASEANLNISSQVARVVARCKEQAESSNLQRQCDKKGEELKQCLTSEAKVGASKEQAEKKCGQLPKK